MEQAIKKAIEGGWKYNKPAECSWSQYDHYLLDPLFWQALGKAEHWDLLSGSYHGYNEDRKTAWIMKWHRFIDHLAEGNSIDSFFNELLSI